MEYTRDIIFKRERLFCSICCQDTMHSISEDSIVCNDCETITENNPDDEPSDD